MRLRHTDDGFKKTVVERLNLIKLLEDPKVADKMAQAGFRGPKPLTTFYFFRFSMPFVFMAVAALYLFVFNDFGLPVMIRLTASSWSRLLIGFYAPNIFLQNRISKRRISIMQAFPDALDLLLICVEAGMSIEAAIQKVSQEIGASSIDLAEELTLLSAELSYLPDRRMAYEGLAKRTNHPGVKSVATAMIQAETYGTPLGDGPAHHGQGKPRAAAVGRREEGRGPAGQADRADDPVLPAGAVHRHPESGDHQHPGHDGRSGSDSASASALGQPTASASATVSTAVRIVFLCLSKYISPRRPEKMIAVGDDAAAWLQLLDLEVAHRRETTDRAFRSRPAGS